LKHYGAVALTSVLLMGLIEPASAQLVPPQVEQNQLDRANPNRSIRQNPQNVEVRINERQAVALAREQFTGNVLRIGLVGQSGNYRYRIRMENEGKIFTVVVHATTGAVSGGN